MDFGMLNMIPWPESNARIHKANPHPRRPISRRTLSQNILNLTCKCKQGRVLFCSTLSVVTKIYSTYEKNITFSIHLGMITKQFCKTVTTTLGLNKSFVYLKKHW